MTRGNAMTTHSARRRPRRPWLLALVLALAVAVATVVQGAAAVPARADVPTTGCGDRLVLGARGSGQAQAGVTDTTSTKYDGGTGLGPQVYSATTSLIAKVINP